VRVGIGFDVHRLVDGRQLILAGESIPYHLGLEGWSDADVVSHALADAVLGAAALGDIGAHFPDTDPRYKDISSLALLSQASALVAAHGFVVQNADVVIVAEAPRLAAYRDAMRGNLAEALGVAVAQVGLKATTTEGLGYTGKGEGIAAQAVVALGVGG